MNQNTIKSPAIFISFDDCHINNWHSCLGFFRKNKMKVTFYICFPDRIEDEEWNKIREIQSEGHTIGFHGLNHMWTTRFIEKSGCQRYLENEIDKGLDFFKKKNIEINDFSYPFGNRNTETDNCLSKRFTTLRGIVLSSSPKYFYNIDELSKLKLIISKRLELASYSLKNLIKQKNIAIFLYSHVSNAEEINALLSLSGQAHFYPMEAIRCT